MKRLTPIPRLKVKLWELCKQYVRQRDGGMCQACGATGLTGANAQTSHLISSSVCGAYLRYDPRNLYLCCYRCNISLSGNIASLYRNIENRKGKAFMERIFEDKQKSIQIDRTYLDGRISEYKDLLTTP